MKKRTVLITEAAMIAAIYTVLVWTFAPISFSGVQCRIAEALTILPFFTPAAIPGLTIGCFIANLTGGADLLDIVFGTFATFLGAVGSYQLRRWKYAVAIAPILSNTLIIPWIIRFAYADTTPIYFLMVTVGIGEVLSCGVLGISLLFVLQKYKYGIFPSGKNKI